MRSLAADWFSSLRFWARVAAETLGGRRLDRVVASRLGGVPVLATGASALPPAGPFVFAVNHLRAGLTMGTIAAVLDAAAPARPDVIRECQLVVGVPARPPTGRFARLVRRLMARFWRRWSATVVPVPLAGGPPSARALRAFRARARERPALVFPEGRAAALFDEVRPGAGTWLAGLAVPVVPVGVFLSEGGWRVAIGEPIEWAARAELRDVQLGLAIAALLPPELAPRWQEPLTRFRSVHAPAA